MSLDLVVLGTSSTVQAVAAATQTNEMFQRVQIIVGIVSACMAALYYGCKFLIKLVKWIKKATKDGKIDEQELDELDKIVDTIKPKEDDND